MSEITQRHPTVTIGPLELLQRDLATATERAERAEALAMTREIGADLSASEVQRAEQQIATLTRERDEFEAALKLTQADFVRVFDERDRLTRELEAERAGSTAMRKGLETIAHCSESFRPPVRDLLSSTAGAEYVATMAAYRLALDRSGCACRSGNVQLGEAPYKCLRCVTLESHTAGAETLERLKELRDGAAWAYQLAGAIGMPVAVLDNLSALAQGEKPPHDWPYPADCEQLRKAEAERDNLADCWQKAEGALNDMEIAKNERITTLEADLAIIATKLGVIITQDSQRIINNATLVIDAKNQHIDELEAALEEAREGR